MPEPILGDTLADDMWRIAFGDIAPTNAKTTSVFFSLMAQSSLNGHEDYGGDTADWLNSEITAADYARVELPQSAVGVTGGRLIISSDIVWTESAAEAWGTVTSVACWRTASGTDPQDLLFAMDFDQQWYIDAGGPALMVAGTLKPRFNAGNVFGTQPA